MRISNDTDRPGRPGRILRSKKVPNEKCSEYSTYIHLLLKIDVSDLPRVNLSTNAVAVEDRNRIELSESDEAEVRLRCAVHANPHAHAVKWLKEVRK